MSRKRLKPCPFCGHRAGKVMDDVYDANGNSGMAVVCSRSTCCIGPVRDAEEAAIRGWNERAETAKEGT